jgi:hypothetical protein
MRVLCSEQDHLNWEESLDEDDLPIETLFDVLADPERRHLLTLLMTATDPVSVDELRTQLIACTQSSQTVTAKSSVQGNGAQRRQIRLRHVHLPKLADCGFIEYDLTAQTVTPTIPSTVEAMLTDLLKFSNS